MKRVVEDFIKDRAKELKAKQSPVENLLWQRIRNNQLGYKFRRQHPIGNRYILDFVCLDKKLVVEVDGEEHGYRLDADLKRDEFLRGEGFEVVRLRNREVCGDIEGCLERILFELRVR